MTRMPASKARENFADVVNRAGFKGERIALERNGKNVAAIVSIEDAEFLERLENESDRRAIRKARREVAKHGTIPYEEVRKARGLK